MPSLLFAFILVSVYNHMPQSIFISSLLLGLHLQYILYTSLLIWSAHKLVLLYRLLTFVSILSLSLPVMYGDLRRGPLQLHPGVTKFRVRSRNREFKH